ncbi:hypothetical protein AMAG_09723 [Allomyces macrogynus ATCC 38327]|uniref:Uncharacterized protein n=1 Tax=Allomyces macrogynus (strain ATCC 38327) TaxID=578462 RepID=A0A0L0STL1_ALLM3|nr:hypothetical protein AMAG_09723 [Allomyces macrogynus ATCC 38327]|eukprot:KNE65745.1 hypothetical protein AMAG_09723 [Allomyces macrogynus ATCC 38327]
MNASAPIPAHRGPAAAVSRRAAATTWLCNLPAAIRKRPWLVTLLWILAASGGAGLVFHRLILPAIRRYLAAVYNLQAAHARAWAALAHLAAVQRDHLRSAVPVVRDARNDGSTLLASIPGHDDLEESSSSGSSENDYLPYTTSAFATLPPAPTTDPLTSLRQMTRDWRAHADATSAAQARPTAGTSLWRAHHPPPAATSVFGCDMARGVRDAVEACRSECRMARSALLTRRVAWPGGAPGGGARSVWGRTTPMPPAVASSSASSSAAAVNGDLP